MFATIDVPSGLRTPRNKLPLQSGHRSINARRTVYRLIDAAAAKTDTQLFGAAGTEASYRDATLIPHQRVQRCERLWNAQLRVATISWNQPMVHVNGLLEPNGRELNSSWHTWHTWHGLRDEDAAWA